MSHRRRPSREGAAAAAQPPRSRDPVRRGLRWRRWLLAVVAGDVLPGAAAVVLRGFRETADGVGAAAGGLHGVRSASVSANAVSAAGNLSATAGAAANISASVLAEAAANATYAANAGAAANATGTQPRGPRVYFLFLAVDKVSNLDVWRAFFAHAPRDLYRAYVHCKLPACNQQVHGSYLEAVPTVPSWYCTDLVSPMQQLVHIALQDQAGYPHPLDKFAFVSDSTLPAKPFAYIYGTLAARHGSDFCVFPSNEWADVPSSGGGTEIAAKHHQWMILERAHAERSWQLWSSGHFHHFMAHFRMNIHPYAWNNNSYADNRNYGCLDEFWHMIALYGTMHAWDLVSDTSLPLASFGGGPLHISPWVGWQGECDTFVMWAKYLHIAGNNPFNRFYSSLDQASIPHRGDSFRPGWWDTISSHGLRAIRQSPFLFVRKFIDKPRLHDGYDFPSAFQQIVLAY